MTLSHQTNQLEDRIGKLAMLIVFGYFAVQAITSITMIVVQRDVIPLWGLALAAQLCSASFLCVALFYTVTRLPSQKSAAGLMPRAVAVTGTFIMVALIVMPAEAISAQMRIVATVITIAGTALSIWCLHQLGRSFSIMATSRELKTTGSYGIVRHPLYGAEVLMTFGVVLSHGTVGAFAIGALWLVLQIRRAQYEEAVLRETFPEYEEYARRVPMLIPGLHLSWIEQGLLLKAKQA
jgi:protein-S-isoprenylcysteine O-methyltransferase Ste14